jgi:hypothetical protein
MAKFKGLSDNNRMYVIVVPRNAERTAHNYLTIEKSVYEANKASYDFIQPSYNPSSIQMSQANKLQMENDALAEANAKQEAEIAKLKAMLDNKKPANAKQEAGEPVEATPVGGQAIINNIQNNAANKQAKR